MQVPEDCPCETIVYRALLRGSWIDPDDTTAVKPEAFFRKASDHDGLSVSRADACAIDDVIKSFNTCFGVASLHVGRLKDLGLTVEPDSLDRTKLLITNLPYENDGSAEAEFIVGQVAKTARLAKILRPPHRRRA